MAWARTDEFPRFELNRLTGALGAEIRGIDLLETCDAAFDDVKRALYKYHVLAVRGQKLDTPRMQQLARRFGPFSGNPVHQGVDGFEDIVKFVREPDDTGKVIGEDWHMDLAWLPKPPGITMNYGEVIPPVGGDTCFANLENLYRALSPRMREMLDGLVGVHSGRGVFAINAAHKGLTKPGAEASDNVEVEHPLVCLHPVSGERYLFISSVLIRFKGMTEEESKPLIDYLMQRAVRPEFTCRVRWEPGTLVMWANPFVLHAAINDYSSYRRVNYRTTIEGATPIAAPPLGQDAVRRAA
jgi:taurine dioxygenase